jgi:hypothetical protein
MADNVPITAGAGTNIAADEVLDGVLGTVKVQYVKLMDGTDNGTAKAAVSANGLKVDGSAVTQPVSDGGGSLTVDGTVAATQSGTWNVADGGGSLTVDDGGSSLTVDGTVGVSGTVASTQSGTWNITNVSGTVSLPTGAATETGVQDVVDQVAGLRSDLAVAPTEVPHEALDSAKDTTTSATFTASSSSEATLIAGAGGQTIRVHEIIIASMNQSTGSSYIEFKDGNSGTVVYRLDFPVAGAWDKPFRARPYIVTSTANNLRVKPSTADPCVITVEYKQSA